MYRPTHNLFQHAPACRCWLSDNFDPASAHTVTSFRAITTVAIWVYELATIPTPHVGLYIRLPSMLQGSLFISIQVDVKAEAILFLTRLAAQILLDAKAYL